jgi:hypothetical protein
MPVLAPEQEARQQIDKMLEAAGWEVQSYQRMNRTAALGVAVCEFPLTTGWVDYMLVADGRPIGVVEAKAVGMPLSGVEPQAMDYCVGLPDGLQPLAWGDPLPFRYESTGVETFFADDWDPDPRSRRVFGFHRPETLIKWAEGTKAPGTSPIGHQLSDEAGQYAIQAPSLRARLRQMPPLVAGELWPAQVRAIENLEASLAQDRPRALIQMATGSGKTFTAVNFVYRLIKHAGANPVLFMVDRTNLGRQASNEFNQFVTPDDGRKFTELYNVLFEGGAGETVRRKLLHECDVHTLLRLPTGVFYAQGVKANVLFFDRRPGSSTAAIKTLWIYDLRTNMSFTLKQNPLTREDLDEFVACYNPENRHERTATWSEENPDDRWRDFDYDELMARDKVNLDIFWLRDESLEETANLPEPDVLAAEIVEDLEAALEQFRLIAEDLGE